MQLEDYSIEEIQSGLHREGGAHTCLACGAEFCEGEIYPIGGRFYDAAHAAAKHVADAHGPWLETLLGSNTKYLPLTAHQQKLLCLLGRGMTDAEVAAETGATAATVRRQRFMFREKAKQARLYLAVFGLAEEVMAGGAKTPPPAKEGETIMIANNFTLTRQEYDQFVQNAFYTTQPLKLRAIPVKAKRRAAVIDKIATLFAPGEDYTEKQVNAILEQVHEGDYVVLRRYLIEYGYLARERDGSRYWVPES